jgi:hypothetical protein
MNEETTAARPQTLRLATLLMAAAVMVGGTGCITTAFLVSSVGQAFKERARNAEDAETQRAEQKKRAELSTQPQ